MVQGAAEPKNQEAKGLPTQSSTSSRVVIKTENGLVAKDQVKQLMQANIAPDAPLVRMISSNQSQEYFAVATS